MNMIKQMKTWTTYISFWFFFSTDKKDKNPNYIFSCFIKKIKIKNKDKKLYFYIFPENKRKQ